MFELKDDWRTSTLREQALERFDHEVTSLLMAKVALSAPDVNCNIKWNSFPISAKY